MRQRQRLPWTSMVKSVARALVTRYQPKAMRLSLARWTTMDGGTLLPHRSSLQRTPRLRQVGSPCAHSAGSVGDGSGRGLGGRESVGGDGLALAADLDGPEGLGGEGALAPAAS